MENVHPYWLLIRMLMNHCHVSLDSIHLFLVSVANTPAVPFKVALLTEDFPHTPPAPRISHTHTHTSL